MLICYKFIKITAPSAIMMAKIDLKVIFSLNNKLANTALSIKFAPCTVGYINVLSKYFAAIVFVNTLT